MGFEDSIVHQTPPVGATREQRQMTDKSKRFATPVDLYRAISKVWATDTSSPTDVWSPSNPAQNHCSVTSLVVQTYFGGQILTTLTSVGKHFYNLHAITPGSHHDTASLCLQRFMTSYA